MDSLLHVKWPQNQGSVVVVVVVKASTPLRLTSVQNPNYFLTGSSSIRFYLEIEMPCFALFPSFSFPSFHDYGM